MGTWEIKIRGTGAHDIGKGAAIALVRSLIGADCTVREASFSLTYTSTEMPAAPHCEGWTDLLPPPKDGG